MQQQEQQQQAGQIVPDTAAEPASAVGSRGCTPPPATAGPASAVASPASPTAASAGGTGIVGGSSGKKAQQQKTPFQKEALEAAFARACRLPLLLRPCMPLSRAIHFSASTPGCSAQPDPIPPAACLPVLLCPALCTYLLAVSQCRAQQMKPHWPLLTLTLVLLRPLPALQ
jgi:hypothetical protein